MDWRARAACTGHDPELWFTVALETGAVGGTHPDVTPAVDVCRTCPVVAECLQWAVRHGIRYGIWGGQTPVERAGAVAAAPIVRLPASSRVGVARSRAWTAEEQAQAIAYDAAGWPHERIARALGRSRPAVATRLHRLRAEADT
jgi:WhiB family redox-sensing transcriptional regulator